jgi:conjugal transfer pilus assembly protein TraW
MPAHPAREDRRDRPLNEELKRRTIARVNRPEPVAGINAASALRSWRFDPTITRRARHCRRQGPGHHCRGTRVNPLDTVPLRAPLVFLDGDDPHSLPGPPALCQHEGQAHPRARRAARTDEGPPAPLLLRPGRQLVKHFGIRAVPATVEQQGRVLSSPNSRSLPRSARRHEKKSSSVMDLREHFCCSLSLATSASPPRLLPVRAAAPASSSTRSPTSAGRACSRFRSAV